MLSLSNKNGYLSPLPAEDVLQVGTWLVSSGSRLVTLMHSQQRYLWESSKQLQAYTHNLDDPIIFIQMILQQQENLIRRSWAAQ